MPLRHRSDSAEWVPGRHHSGNRGRGELGSSMPGTGDSGGGFLGPVVGRFGLQADEVRAFITTAPVGLTWWWVDEFGRLEAEGPDGAYFFEFRTDVNGVALTFSSPYGAGITRVVLRFGSSTGLVLVGSEVRSMPTPTGRVLHLLPSGSIAAGAAPIPDGRPLQMDAAGLVSAV